MELMAHLPAHLYNNEEHVSDILRAVGIELEKLEAAREDLLLQLRPSTATWGMKWHEEDYGIIPDSTKPLEQRRAAWRAKRRGVGTSTVEQVRRVVQSFTEAAVTVTERPREYAFDIDIAAANQALPNVADMHRAVGEMKPAHLGYGTKLRQELWSQYHVGALGCTRPHITIPPRFNTGAQGKAERYMGAASITRQHITILPRLPTGVEAGAVLRTGCAVRISSRITVYPQGGEG